MTIPKKLFCIIEEDTVRMFFETVLEMHGWEVYALEETDDASFRIPEFSPDFIILDTGLVAPQRELIKEWDTGKAKIIGLGFSAERNLWGDELDAFLEKPLDPITLVDKILALV
jgi:DNA-binding response OmpR family regulator